VRGGSIDPHWHIGIGAVWLYALDAPITAQIDLLHTTLLDSSQQALLLLGQRIDGLTVKDLRVERGASLMELRAAGNANFEGVDATGVPEPRVLTCGAFLVNWQGSTQAYRSSGADGC
jgi:hypothetical protein